MLLSVVGLLSMCLLAGRTEFGQNPLNSTQHKNRTDVGSEPETGPGSGSADGNLNQQKETRHEVLQEGSTFSGLFGFGDLAGVRSFVPEQQVETRIIGGQEAWSHSWPWQVSLRFASMPACGGAVIGPTWVLSAAHCFKRFNKASFWTVLAGKHDLDNPHEAHQQLVGVSVIFSHHGYNPRTKDLDVALLKLQQPLEFGLFVRPIDVWMSALPLLGRCTVTGWGSTRENGPRVNRLQEVNVTILPSEECNRYYSGRIRNSMFCAGKDEGGVDACQGDSGGPLSCFNGSRYELVGLVSWGVGCGRARRPGVYTKVQLHTDWIRDLMSQDKVHEDEMTAEEDRCGKQQSSRCDPGLAGLSVSHDGVLCVGNVSESCPFTWPWMVSLQSEGRHVCSGALIHRRWVLTAKHCGIRAKKGVVVLGVHDLRFLSTQTLLVDEVFEPPQDSSFPPKADLSLLRLHQDARFGSNISPVCVPEEDEDLDDSWSCITAGWGATKATVGIDPKRLHHAGLTLVNETSCRKQWGDSSVTRTSAHILQRPLPVWATLELLYSVGNMAPTSCLASFHGAAGDATQRNRPSSPECPTIIPGSAG
ncbi:ovochymase-1 isoform X2 [Acanthochromis polyacanthus]|uniref:ovochymase-1 isoform X2 n=1 Tax=Acanthochromis polyacanthus TaxID=80966 RepID=UPI0022345BD3|nr:ovochymase-1 isoform X2 [Acanthochromis polyacanthus]